MRDERIYLKVKILSLAAEARIIRKETKRAKRISIKNGLAEHRKGIVRFEARHTQLAYGFLRGLEYRQMEQKAHEEPNWKRVRDMVKKYGSHWDSSTISLLEPDHPCNYVNQKKHLEEVLIRLDAWIIRAKTNETSIKD